MKIEVRLFATLAAFLPPASKATGSAVLDIPEGGTVADVVSRLSIPPVLPCIALVNGEDAGPERRLAAHDVVTLFPPLAGGR